MQSGNGLHGSTVAVRKAPAINVLHPADIRVAIASDWNALITMQPNWHGGGQQYLFLQLPVSKGMEVAQEAQGVIHLGEWRCDEFNEGLGIIRGNPRVGQCGTKGCRVGGLGDLSRHGETQAFLFQSLESSAQQ